MDIISIVMDANSVPMWSGLVCPDMTLVLISVDTVDIKVVRSVAPVMIGSANVQLITN